MPGRVVRRPNRARTPPAICAFPADGPREGKALGGHLAASAFFGLPRRELGRRLLRELFQIDLEKGSCRAEPVTLLDGVGVVFEIRGG